MTSWIICCPAASWAARSAQRILQAALAASREGFWARWRGRARLERGRSDARSGRGSPAAVAAGARRRHRGLPASRDRADTPLITVSCLGAMLNACPPGSRVAFALEGGRDTGRLPHRLRRSDQTGRAGLVSHQRGGRRAPGRRRRRGWCERRRSSATVSRRAPTAFTRSSAGVPSRARRCRAWPRTKRLAHVELDLVVPQ